ncbi:MAG: hypothetical protein IJ264_02985, partial [Clostridia bacterium]|nr:hypothetical protein [Clostridia bacterium]
KIIFVFCAILIVAGIGFAAAKTSLPNAVFGLSETVNYVSATQNSLNLSTTATTKSTTTTVTQTNAPTSTVESTTSTTTAKETTVEYETEIQTSTATTHFLNITFPFPVFTAPTTAVTAPEKIDFSCFDNCAFVGNSRIISLKNYGLAKNVFSVVGLNVDTVFTKSVSGSSVPVIDELNGKKFDKIILMFGDNECGWPNADVFVKRYSKVIAAVKERIPEAEIYLHSVLPVSNEASATSEFGCNNPTINKLNEKIKQLAVDEGIGFIEQPVALKCADGSLLTDAASDGIHLNKKYSVIWLDYMAREIIYE